MCESHIQLHISFLSAKLIVNYMTNEADISAVIIQICQQNDYLSNNMKWNRKWLKANFI